MDEVRYVRGDPEFVVKTYVTRGLTAEEFLNAVQVDDLKHDNDMKTYLTWGFPEKQQSSSKLNNFNAYKRLQYAL